MSLRDDILARTDLASAVADHDCTTIATAMSLGRTELGSVIRADFAIWATVTGMRAKIEDHAMNVNSPLRSIALSLRDFILGSANSIDFTIPENIQALDAWVSANELDITGKASLLQKATIDVVVTSRDVAEALYNDDGSVK